VSKLKDKVDEFSAIAKSLPENLQVVCFELLLRNHLEGARGPSEDTRSSTPEKTITPHSPLPAVSTTPPADTGAKQEDLKTSDLHLKAKRFLEKYALSLDELNNLFFKEDGQFKPLYEDLKTTRMSENQIRVTLLLALRNAITTGEFEIEVQAVHDECVQRKCFDGKNFSANYNNNGSLFDFTKFTKETRSVRLSEAGRKELADVVKELQ